MCGKARTRWCIGLQGCDDPGLGDLIRTAVLHVDRSQQEHVTLLGDAGGNGLHDFAIDRLLIVCDEVLVQEFLDLIRREPGGDVSDLRNVRVNDTSLAYIQQISWMISMSFKVAFLSCKSLVACCEGISEKSYQIGVTTIPSSAPAAVSPPAYHGSCTIPRSV